MTFMAYTTHFIHRLLPIFIGIFLISFSLKAKTEDDEKSEKFNPGETIMHHIADAHEWEFFIIGETHYTLPLPVILYTPNGLDVFMSYDIHHGKEIEIEKVLEGFFLPKGTKSIKNINI